MAASKTIGGINVTISATTDKFSKGISKARKILGGFVTGLKSAIFSVKGFVAVMTGGALAAGFTILTKNAFLAVDAMNDMSTKLGVSTDKIYGLQLAAEEAGVSQTVLERALVKLSTTMGMEGSAALRKWIEDTGKLGTHQERLAAAVAMFGSRGAEMVRFLQGGTEALDEAQEAAELFGMNLSTVSVKGVDRAIEAFGRLKKAVGGIFANLAVELAPFIEALSTKLTGFLTEGGKVKKIGSAIANAVIGAAKFVVDGVQRMVGGVLTAVAEIRGAVYGFRTSKFATTVGLGYKSDSAMDAAGSSMQTADYNARVFNAAAPWSQGIDAMVAAASAATLKAFVGGSVANKSLTMGRDKSGGFGSIAKNLPAALLAGLTGGGDLGAIGRMGQKGAGAAGMASPGFSLAQSGSAESYRQQAAIRRQNEGLKVERDQLRELRHIAQTLDKGEPLQVANL